MSEQENIGVLKKLFEAFTAADFAELRAAFVESEDWAGSMRRAAELGGAMAKLSRVATESLAPEIEWKAAGDRVRLELEIRARGTGSGVLVSMHFFHLFTMREGKIVGLTNFLDRDAATVALGAVGS